jgi:hypothetical protein
LDLAGLLPDLATLMQGGSLLALLGVLLRVMYVERREHRDDAATYRERIKELESERRDALREHEAEVDAERDKRRAAEDREHRRAGWPLKAAGEGEE